jgi:hypothetical protein
LNLSLLPEAEQRNLELSRQAALLIHQLNRAEITRVDILKKIDALEESEQPIFKELLNKYRAVK